MKRISDISMWLKVCLGMLFAGTGLLTSCSEMTDMLGDDTCNTVITAAMPDAETARDSRTCIDTEHPAGGSLGLLWQTTDTLGVYGKGGTRNAEFKSLSADRAAKADFGGHMNAGDDPWRAYYPYSAANNGRDVTALQGTLPQVQPYDVQTGKLTGDYKYGAPVSGTKQFNFRHIFAMLRVQLNATGTPLEGERLDRVEVTVTDADGNERPINGTFTFSAVDGGWSMTGQGTNKVVMPWTGRPTLTANSMLQGFVTVMPNIRQGDRFDIKVLTEAHKATFHADCKVNFEAENIYNIPLTLSTYAENAALYDYKVTELPTIRTFSFAVAENTGKILDKKLRWNSSNNPQFDKVDVLNADIAGSDISLMIPYLHNFKLVPRFTVANGATVSVNGVEQVSGKTEVDFTKPVTYTVTADGDSRDYTVSITNTGLPVVVINQSKSGDFSEEKEGGFLGIGAKVVNKFVDFMIRGKETNWVEDDMMTVYNADGTIDMTTAACGVRLRGNTSKAYPKKPMAVKFVEKQAVLGMPAHKRWVLLANWLDHSMIRNSVAFDVAHAMEQAWKSGTIEKGIPWNVHGQNVELIIDGQHVGNYYLCEQIKIGGKRLDIQDNYEDVVKDGKVEPTFENCGYLLELDTNYDETYRFITSHYSVPFMFKDDVLTNDIMNAVKAKVQGIENNIYAGNFAAAYNDLDINTVVDQWLIYELTMNHEFLDPRSVYYFMNGNGKLCAGPVWDFDRATFQNVENAKAQGSSGDRLKPYDQWICWSANPKAGLSESKLEDGRSCVWYPELVTDPTFCQTVQKRWAVMLPYLQGVINNIRAYGERMQRSYKVNNEMWPTTKAAIHKHKSGFTDWSGDENIADYKDVIENMVTVYQNRLNGMNSLITSGKFTK